MTKRQRIAYGLSGIGSIVLLVSAWQRMASMEITEALAFVTGAYCVWLTVKEHIWNWPLGIANSLFLLIVFMRARLYADSALQILYVVLGFLGWYWWLHGDAHRAKLSVKRSPLSTLLVLVLLLIPATLGMTLYLQSIKDSSPFLDALTTCLSLAAQYLLTRKFIESWLLWIGVDVIYIYLYASRDLYLTSVLYLLFLTMCLMGWKEWKQQLSAVAVPSEHAA
jgi:nicotinamide mononucleotide transporter